MKTPGTQIFCTKQAREQFKVMARMEGRTLAGYLTSLADQEKRRWPVTDYRKARREMLAAPGSG